MTQNGTASAISFAQLRHDAKERAAGFLETAAMASDARDAASWSLAARNATDIALKCEQALATGRQGGRR